MTDDYKIGRDGGAVAVKNGTYPNEILMVLNSPDDVEDGWRLMTNAEWYDFVDRAFLQAQEKAAILEMAETSPFN